MAEEDKANPGGTPQLRKSPAIQLPSIDDLQQISRDLKMKCTTEELSEMHENFKGLLQAYQRVYELVEPQLPVKYPRVPGFRETEDDSWYWRCDIKGADSGLLAGKTLAIKDNVCVAGVPMMNGSKVLEGYTPEIDATVVTRILDAGGRILGKSVCEDLCFSAGSATSSTGPVRNPHDATRTTGGSSSGSASLVTRGIVDMAIGGDQGGSIRIPASCCGIVGLKPTFGLVPYTGIMAIEHTIDHTGPMARTVKDCATLLEAIAGYDDGRDPRQPLGLKVPQYTKMLDVDIKGKKIGILKEGFIGAKVEVAVCVREAANKMTKLGVEVSEVSIPMHNDGMAIWTVIEFEGSNQIMMKGNGNGYGWKGHYALSLQEALAKGFNLRRHDLPRNAKTCSIWGEYMEKHYQNKFYAKAQNLNMRLTDAYNEALKEYDVLVMRTLLGKPFKLPVKDKLPSKDDEDESFPILKNTAPFDTTGHPALSINAGTVSGLPCGMMFVGRLFDDVTVLQIAQAFEKMK